MIKNTHPEFEELAARGEVEFTFELGEFLRILGVDYVESGGLVKFAQSVELLDLDTLLKAVRDLTPIHLNDSLHVEIHRAIGSTNLVTMESLGDRNISSMLCVAEMQTAGKGRRGRHWVSPFGRNIYMSYGRFMQKQLPDLGGLSLVVGMQVIDALRQVGLQGVGLKWPNDVLLAGRKLAGILVELKPAESRGIGVVVGVGINLSLERKDATSIDQPWSAADSHTRLPRNRLLGLLSGKILNAIDLFNQEGFGAFSDRWNEYNLFEGQQVAVIRGEEKYVGVDRGVDDWGNLLLETASGIESHNSGEVSMRPIDLQ